MLFEILRQCACSQQGSDNRIGLIDLEKRHSNVVHGLKSNITRIRENVLYLLQKKTSVHSCFPCTVLLFCSV